MRLPEGREARREVVEHIGAVTVVATAEDDRVVLVRQWRHAAGRALWELPAGTREPGEEPAATARRELTEETGYGGHRVARARPRPGEPRLLERGDLVLRGHAASPPATSTPGRGRAARRRALRRLPALRHGPRRRDRPEDARRAGAGRRRPGPRRWLTTQDRLDRPRHRERARPGAGLDRHQRAPRAAPPSCSPGRRPPRRWGATSGRWRSCSPSSRSAWPPTRRRAPPCPRTRHPALAFFDRFGRGAEAPARPAARPPARDPAAAGAAGAAGAPAGRAARRGPRRTAARQRRRRAPAGRSAAALAARPRRRRRAARAAPPAGGAAAPGRPGRRSSRAPRARAAGAGADGAGAAGSGRRRRDRRRPGRPAAATAAARCAGRVAGRALRLRADAGPLRAAGRGDRRRAGGRSPPCSRRPGHPRPDGAVLRERRPRPRRRRGGGPRGERGARGDRRRRARAARLRRHRPAPRRRPPRPLQRAGAGGLVARRPPVPGRARRAARPARRRAAHRPVLERRLPLGEHARAAGRTSASTRLLDAAVFSGEVGWRKPSPRLFEAALRALGARAERDRVRRRPSARGRRRCGGRGDAHRADRSRRLSAAHDPAAEQRPRRGHPLARRAARARCSATRGCDDVRDGNPSGSILGERPAARDSTAASRHRTSGLS